MRESPWKKWRASVKWGLFYLVGFLLVAGAAYWVVTNASTPPPTGIIHHDY